jgi:hypothetical protein
MHSNGGGNASKEEGPRPNQPMGTPELGTAPRPRPIGTTVTMCLFILAILYPLAGISGFAVWAAAQQRAVPETVAAQFFRYAFYDSSTGLLCIAALIAALRRSRHAGPAAIIAAVAAGTLAVRALGTALTSGLHIYHLVEPTIILPCVSTILWKLRACFKNPNSQL